MHRRRRAPRDRHVQDVDSRRPPKCTLRKRARTGRQVRCRHGRSPPRAGRPRSRGSASPAGVRDRTGRYPGGHSERRGSDVRASRRNAGNPHRPNPRSRGSPTTPASPAAAPRRRSHMRSVAARTRGTRSPATPVSHVHRRRPNESWLLRRTDASRSCTPCKTPRGFYADSAAFALSFRASMALTVFASVLPRKRLPMIRTASSSTRPFTFLPSRTTTTSTSVVPLGCRVKV